MPRAPPVLFRPVGNPGLRKRRVDGKRRVGDPALPEQCVDAVRR